LYAGCELRSYPAYLDFFFAFAFALVFFAGAFFSAGLAFG
jgi:hypothetical protein